MKKKIAIAYLLIFGVMVCGVGLLSGKKLIDFYINDEVDYNEWSVDLGNKFETDVASTFFEKFQFININGFFRKIIGQREMNGVVKLNNGYLLTTIDYVDDDTLQRYANNIAILDQYLKNRGTNLVYAMTPYTSGKYDPQLPIGISDFGNDNADRLLSDLRGLEVDTIDFRETMHEDGIDHYSMMYKTDHHWNTKAGIYAYGILEDYIVDKTGCDIDNKIRDKEQYTITTYKKWHLGSRGQRTGRYFAGIDDFELYIPNFETTIQNDAGEVGNMQDLVINMEPLEKRDEKSRYTYDSVLGYALGHYMNLKAKNNIKVLIVTDSFGKAVTPYLMMAFSEITYIYDIDVSCINPESIESYDPDVVILMYYTENAMKEGAYNFQGFN